jgi:hypothetical protein
VSMVDDGLFGMQDVGEDPKVVAVVEALHRIQGWPVDEVKDHRLAVGLVEEYGYENLPQRIHEWDCYRQRVDMEVRSWRGRVRTWFQEGRRHGVERRGNRTGAGRSASRITRAGDVRASAVPGTAAQFGASRRLDDW